MASLTYQPRSPASAEPPWVQIDPVNPSDLLLDGWWPNSPDLGAELRVLVPVLDRVRGPVARLLLAVGDWTDRPHHIVTANHAVSIGYCSGQPATVIRVFCADGGAFTMRVGPRGPAPSTPSPSETGWNGDVWEAEGGGLGSLRNRAVR